MPVLIGQNTVLDPEHAPIGQDRFLLERQHLLDHKTHLMGMVAHGLAALPGYSRFLILNMHLTGRIAPTHEFSSIK